MQNGSTAGYCCGGRTDPPRINSGETMRALAWAKHGGPEVMELTTVPKPPEPIKDEVLIKLKACSFNPLDFKRRNGAMKAVRPEVSFPVIAGYDGAGVVESVGPNCKHLKVGDMVYTRVVGPTQGTAAEYTLAGEAVTAIKPVSCSIEEAAAMPLAAMTALQMLRKGNFAPGHKVFVAAGAGGVGHYAIQIAKALGAAYVTTTASGPKVELMKELGANTVVNYREEKMENLKSHEYDVALDMVGESSQMVHLVKEGGSLISVTDGMNAAVMQEVGLNTGFLIGTVLWLKSRGIYNQAARANINFTGMLLKPNRDDLIELARLVDEGKIKSMIKDNVFTGIDALPDAFAKLESGRVTGKLVVAI